MSYANTSLLEIEKQFNRLPKEISLDGQSLTIPEIVHTARNTPHIEITQNAAVRDRIQRTYDLMIDQVERGVPIYGCNTGYGERASVVLTQGTKEERIALAKAISEAIQHTDVTVGPKLEKEVVRGAIVIRLNMLMSGVSGVRMSTLEAYRSLLNHEITPVVNQYGGVGASGDLAHNSRVLSALRGLSGTLVQDSKGNVREAVDALRDAGLKPLDLDPKTGLGLVNGDNFSTAVAALLARDTVSALLLSHVIGAMTIEVLKGTDRSFHPLLAGVRPHAGQREVADIYRFLLRGSKLAFQEMGGHLPREKGIKVQDGYSLRCISQYHGVNQDKLKHILDTITVNANSVSDNPLWVTPEYAEDGEEPGKWVSGGNFIAMHMVEAIDGLRKTMTQIVKLNDRHLARIVSPNQNNGLPANLSDSAALSQCTFKGVQIQSGMFDVYSSLLSMPVSTFFGVHEEGNQDITSHALTSGILGLENLRLVRYSLAQNAVALAQAVDLRGGPKLLSDQTRPLYNLIRSKATYVATERPLHAEIESMYESIVDGTINRELLNNVFKAYE